MHSRVGASFLWGRNLDFLLNDEFIVFAKVGLGYGRSDLLDDHYDGVYGIGVQFVTKNFIISMGVDKENRNYGGWALSLEPFYKSVDEKVINQYFSIGVTF
jgi:hypothetical protein